jgi:anthranilate synthase component 2
MLPSAVRVLLVDNYDSFTYNLVQALRALDAEVCVRRNDALDPAAARALEPDAIVISPGPRTPADAGVSTAIVGFALAEHVPLLGVCLGHQAIGVAVGGRVLRAERLRHGKTSPIRHAGGRLYAGIPDPFQAMRYHSLVVEQPLPDTLEVTAWVERPDGPDELMGFRHRDAPVEGVQFHPESYLTPEGPRLLGNFLASAREHRR